VLDFSLGKKDHLTTPYVVGAEVGLWVRDESSDRDTDFTGWSLASSDPEVLRISGAASTEAERVSARAFAMGDGVADLILVDDEGRAVTSVEVPVHFPTHFELQAAAPAFLKRPDLPATTERPQVLVDGEATFLVRYFDGPRQLYGNGALQVGSDPDMRAWVAHSYLFENRDWLQLSPREEGAHIVDLRVGGRTVSELEVRAVGPDDVAEIVLYGEDESRAAAGQRLLVIAQAYDEDAEPIYGVDYVWSLEDQEEDEHGDMFRYVYDPDARSTLAADFGDAHAEATIRGTEGWVGSSNEIGCSVVAHRRTPAWSLLLLGVALATRRRRVGMRPH
jgi:hypothetical protein